MERVKIDLVILNGI